MGPTQEAKIPEKVKKAINIFNTKLSKIDSPKEQRSIILKCTVTDQFNKDFNLNQWIHIARYVLENDKIIERIRQKLVSSMIKENDFWMRYFYLVKEEKKKNSQKSKKKKHKKTKSKIKDKVPINEIVEEESYQMLLHKPIIWLYKISGQMWRGRNNKCELWGLRNPIWQGRLRIVAFNHGKDLEFQFLEKDGKIFLKSTRIKLEEISVDDDSNPIHQYFDAYGVIDSSRYFIIWVDVPTKKQQFDHKIPFGFGIRERQDAFDIRAAVADQMKIIQRDKCSVNKKMIRNDMEYENVSGDSLNDDEMISIGHNIDNIDHQTDDALQKQQHSVILKMMILENFKCQRKRILRINDMIFKKMYKSPL